MNTDEMGHYRNIEWVTAELSIGFRPTAELWDEESLMQRRYPGSPQSTTDFSCGFEPAPVFSGGVFRG